MRFINCEYKDVKLLYNTIILKTKNLQTTTIYKKQKQAEIAINRVIDYVNDPEKYKDYIEMRADIMMTYNEALLC